MKNLLLTKIYERLLRESSVSSNIAFCALNPDDDEVRMGVAYDTSKISLPPGGQKLSEEDVLPAIIAVITITEPGAPKFKCNGAWKVASVAGPGKLAYGMGYYLSPTHKLIPDRKSITSAAMNAWEKQYNLSTLEETQPIDPVDSAGNHLEDDRFHDEHHTPDDPDDDCSTYPPSPGDKKDRTLDAINHALTVKPTGKHNMQSYENNAKDLFRAIRNSHGPISGLFDVTRPIESATLMYFDNHFNELRP